MDDGVLCKKYKRKQAQLLWYGSFVCE